MSVTPMSTSIADTLYYRTHATTAATKSTAGESTGETKESGSTAEDRVTFSSDLSLAQTRAAMGLSPTGILTLKDLEQTAQERKGFVSSTLEETLQGLGIELDQGVSLSMDANDQIHISGDFPEKASVEEILNENEEFTTAFKQLSANQSVLDHISQLQTSVQTMKASIVDYFNSGADFNDLLALADKYEGIKSSENKMGTVLDLSISQNPYSYTYAPDADAE